MLLLHRPNNPMEQEFSHGMNPLYDPDRQRRTYNNNELPQLQHYQDNSAQGGNHTLPPIHPQRPSFDHGSNQYDPSRRQQPLPTTLANSYPTYTPQVTQAPYHHGLPSYQHDPSIFPQQQHQMPVAQAYPTPTSSFPTLRPMPTPAPGQHAMQAGYAPNAGFGFAPTGEEQEIPPRTHVVGSQGRRGILPSDEGKPAAVASNGTSTAKTPVIPQKDADGKYPCPHCQKTYLHGKHLKRHLLRRKLPEVFSCFFLFSILFSFADFTDTGDRPYSCFLCQDTFSRSDILKRHFQKCSIRRGNPTGASHLSHSQNHLKKQGAKKAQTPTTIETNFSGVTQPGMSSASPIYTDQVAIGMGPVGATQHQQTDVKHFGDVRDARALGPSAGVNRPNYNYLTGQSGSASLPSSGSSTPLTAKGTQFPQHFQNDAQRQRVNSYSDMGQRNMGQIPGGAQFDGNGFDWSPYQHGKDGSGIPPEGMQGLSKFQSSKPDDQQDDFLMGSMRGGYGREMGNMDVLNGWIISEISLSKVDQLTIFCQLDGSNDPDEELLRLCLTPSYLQHFMSQYSTFHQHWPFLHPSTFDPNNTHDGLLLAIICIGAAYSDRVSIQQTRSLMRRVYAAIKRASQFFNGPPSDIPWMDNEKVDSIVELLHGICMMTSTALWHGDDFQRVEAMQDFVRYSTIVWQLRLHEPAPITNPKHSILHGSGKDTFSATNFSWSSWLWQEKRIRFMYAWFLTDSVRVLFFNCAPSLDPLQLRLPLPCDDAAWDADTAEKCAAALGLHGTESQKTNISGSRLAKQPEMHLAMFVLEESSKEFSHCVTNAWGKFILIHGLLVRLWTAQKHSSLKPAKLESAADACEWVKDSSESVEISFEREMTPRDTHYSEPFEVISMALDKWKKTWDQDMKVQYPPGAQRIGYSRDGIHYYWLAKLLLQNASRINPYTPWNDRFGQVLAILKSVKSWVSSNQASRGEETGALSEIHESYGLADLTKDMKLLFTPIKGKPPTPPHLISSTWNG
jgi:hypothetical protein